MINAAFHSQLLGIIDQMLATPQLANERPYLMAMLNLGDGRNQNTVTDLHNHIAACMQANPGIYQKLQTQGLHPTEWSGILGPWLDRMIQLIRQRFAQQQQVQYVAPAYQQQQSPIGYGAPGNTTGAMYLPPAQQAAPAPTQQQVPTYAAPTVAATQPVVGGQLGEVQHMTNVSLVQVPDTRHISLPPGWSLSRFMEGVSDPNSTTPMRFHVGDLSTRSIYNDSMDAFRSLARTFPGDPAVIYPRTDGELLVGLWAYTVSYRKVTVVHGIGFGRYQELQAAARTGWTEQRWQGALHAVQNIATSSEWNILDKVITLRLNELLRGFARLSTITNNLWLTTMGDIEELLSPNFDAPQTASNKWRGTVTDIVAHVLREFLVGDPMEAKDVPGAYMSARDILLPPEMNERAISKSDLWGMQKLDQDTVLDAIASKSTVLVSDRQFLLTNAVMEDESNRIRERDKGADAYVISNLGVFQALANQILRRNLSGPMDIVLLKHKVAASVFAQPAQLITPMDTDNTHLLTTPKTDASW